MGAAGRKGTRGSLAGKLGKLVTYLLDRDSLNGSTGDLR